MADFYAILKDAIAGSAADKAEDRAILYARAREALEKRLSSISPPPSEELRQQKREALEEAVLRIEAESGNGQPKPEVPSGAAGTEPEAAKERAAQKQAQVEVTGKDQAKGQRAVSGSGAVPSGRVALGKSFRRRGASVLVALLVLAIVANIGSFAYWQWSNVRTPAGTVAQPVVTELESEVRETRPEWEIGKVSGVGKRPDTSPSTAISPVPRRVQTLIVRSDGSVATFQAQRPTISSVYGSK